MDYKDLAIKWFNKGNNDLIAGKYILSMLDPLADIICFHSQQDIQWKEIMMLQLMRLIEPLTLPEKSRFSC